jgi:acyl-coenzyme A thioesterase PaaI-like protein
MVIETETPALQDVWPNATCFGCGPANPQGLHFKSYWDADGETVVATFQPEHKYNAGFPNVMYGGIVAALIDCHSIWTAIATTYKAEGREHGSLPAISYVTGTITVRFLQPTPLDTPIRIRARVTELHARKARVTSTVYAGDHATAEGTVLAVRFEQDKSLGAG